MKSSSEELSIISSLYHVKTASGIARVVLQFKKSMVCGCVPTQRSTPICSTMEVFCKASLQLPGAWIGERGGVISGMTVCVCVCVCAYKSVHMCVHIHVCMCRYACTCIYAYSYIHVHVCVCGPVYIRVLEQLQRHAHTHTLSHSPNTFTTLFLVVLPTSLVAIHS